MACVSCNLHVLLTSASKITNSLSCLIQALNYVHLVLLSLGLIELCAFSVRVSGCGNNQIPPITRDTFIPSS